MFNEITFGTESLRISILGHEVEVLTGGFMKDPLEKGGDRGGGRRPPCGPPGEVGCLSGTRLPSRVSGGISLEGR